MTMKTNTAEGQTNTTVPTTGNTGGGSGDAFSTVTITGTNTIVFSTAQKQRGSLSYKYDSQDSANSSYMNLSDTGAATWSVRFYVYLTAYPSATNYQGPVGIRSGADASIGRVSISDTGQVKVVYGTANNTSTFSTSVLALNTWYRFEVYGSGAGTASADITCDVYVGDNTGTPYITTGLTGQNTTATVGICRFGRVGGTVTLATFYIDDIAMNVGSATPIGPSISSPAATDSETLTESSALLKTFSATDSATQSEGTTGLARSSSRNDAFFTSEVSSNTSYDDGLDDATLSEGASVLSRSAGYTDVLGPTDTAAWDATHIYSDNGVPTDSIVVGRLTNSVATDNSTTTDLSVVALQAEIVINYHVLLG